MNRDKIIAALYDTGVMAQGNILSAYYKIFTSIAYNNNISFVKEDKLIELFRDELKIDFPTSFVRFILSIGKKNGEVSYKEREYSFNIQRENKQINEFDINLLKIGRHYQIYANKQKKFINTNDDEELKKLVLEYIGYLNDENENNKDLFLWSKFVLSLQIEKPELFEFISIIRFSMAYADFLFYNSYDEKYDGLIIMLDTPIMLSLLGFDDVERVKTARLLVEKLNAKNCKLEVLDNNYEEMDRIIEQAKKYAYSSSYDSLKANNACKSMHDSMQIKDVESIQLKIDKILDKYNISICDYNYDTKEYTYYEDEQQLYRMIEGKYNESSKNNEPDYKNESIEIDAKNINKIYLMRQGNKSTNLKNCKAVLITTNYTLFVVSKNYKCNSYYLPAVVTADYIIAMLFANDIRDVKEYRTTKLIEICTEITRPPVEVYKKFIDLVNHQEEEGTLTEEQVVVLKNKAFTDPVIAEVTDNNPDNIVDETTREVYQKIINGRTREYDILKGEKERDVKKHNEELLDLNKKIEDIENSKNYEIQELKKKNDETEQRKREDNRVRVKNAEKVSSGICIVFSLIVTGILTYIVNINFSTNFIGTIIVLLLGGLVDYILIKAILYMRIRKLFMGFMHAEENIEQL